MGEELLPWLSWSKAGSAERHALRWQNPSALKRCGHERGQAVTASSRWLTWRRASGRFMGGRGCEWRAAHHPCSSRKRRLGRAARGNGATHRSPSRALNPWTLRNGRRLPLRIAPRDAKRGPVGPTFAAPHPWQRRADLGPPVSVSATVDAAPPDSACDFPDPAEFDEIVPVWAPAVGDYRPSATASVSADVLTRSACGILENCLGIQNREGALRLDQRSGTRNVAKTFQSRLVFLNHASARTRITDE